jgi:hypothetical protein
VDRQFRFQFGDAPPGSDQLGLVGSADARKLSCIDEFLPPAVIDRLIADPQIADQLRHGEASLQQVQHITTKLGCIAFRHPLSRRRV